MSLTVVCPSCKSIGPRGDKAYRRCSDCGLLFQVERPLVESKSLMFSIFFPQKELFLDTGGFSTSKGDRWSNLFKSNPVFRYDQEFINFYSDICSGFLGTAFPRSVIFDPETACVGKTRFLIGMEKGKENEICEGLAVTTGKREIHLGHVMFIEEDRSDILERIKEAQALKIPFFEYEDLGSYARMT